MHFFLVRTAVEWRKGLSCILRFRCFLSGCSPPSLSFAAWFAPHIPVHVNFIRHSDSDLITNVLISLLLHDLTYRSPLTPLLHLTPPLLHLTPPALTQACRWGFLSAGIVWGFSRQQIVTAEQDNERAWYATQMYRYIKRVWISNHFFFFFFSPSLKILHI